MKNKTFELSNNLVEYSRRAKVLEKDEEYELISKWRDHKDQKALQKILDAYLRLAVSYSRKFSRYSLSSDDLIHEGVLGIMHALDKFDINKGFRLSTYASWWIRASMQDFILKNWSIVRTGSTASQKQLFFNLKKIKQQILDVSMDFMGQSEINEVSKLLNIKSMEIQNMESRLSGGDVFLNKPIGDEDGNDLMSILEDESENPEEVTQNINDNKLKDNWLASAVETLSDREQTIIKNRKLIDKSLTLDELGNLLSISKERVRQIEVSALKKLKTAILNISQQEKEFFV